MIAVSVLFIACIINVVETANMHELASRYKLESSVRSARKTRKLTKSSVQIFIGIRLS